MAMKPKNDVISVEQLGFLKEIEKLFNKRLDEKLEPIDTELKNISNRLNIIEGNHLSHIEVYMSQICKKNDVPYVDPDERSPKPLKK